MLGPLNQHIGRKLALFIVAFGFAFTFQAVSASAGNDNKSCQPTIPYSLSPSELDELRKELLEKENARDRKLRFEMDFDLNDYPLFLMLSAAKHIDHGEPTSALFHLELLDLAPEGAKFCQYRFIHEISASLRFAAIKSLLTKNSRNFRIWEGFGFSAMRYTALNQYEIARCVILNTEAEVLKLDRDPIFKEYPTNCWR